MSDNNGKPGKEGKTVNFYRQYKFSLALVIMFAVFTLFVDIKDFVISYIPEPTKLPESLKLFVETHVEGSKSEDLDKIFNDLNIAAKELIIWLTLVILTIFTAAREYTQKSLEKFTSAIKKNTNTGSNQTEELEKVSNSVSLLADKVNSSTYKEKVRFGLFDNLLIYAPIFVAHELGYFDDEGIEVEIDMVGSDKGVADGLRKGEYDFGVCDPIFTLEQETPDKEEIFILMPLVKRLDITAFARKDLLISDASEEVRNDITISCYKRPSTTYSSAMALKNELEKLEIFKQINIFEIGTKDIDLETHSGINAVLKSSDIVLLWNPSSNLLLNDKDNTTKKQYGKLLSHNHSHKRGNKDTWKVIGLDEGVNDDELNYWTPVPNVNDKNYQILVSSLLATKSLISTRPELSRSVFNAISKALVRIQGANWEIEDKIRDHSKTSLFSVLGRRANIGQDIVLNTEEIKTFIFGTTNHDNSERKSIFPFISGIKEYHHHKQSYANHLKNLHSLWKNDKEISDKFITSLRTTEDYEKFFCNIKKA